MRRNVRAATLGFMAFAVFSGADVLVKLLAERFQVPQVTFMITIAALVLLSAYAGATGSIGSLLPRHPYLALMRALLLAVDTLLIHYAFSMLPLAEAYLLAFLTPLLVAILAFVLLGERLSPLAWSGVMIGFTGVAGDASVVAPFQYSQIIWGGLYGALLFSAPIELHTIIGAVVIVLSAWLVLK